jgi:hypothetical protein
MKRNFLKIIAEYSQIATRETTDTGRDCSILFKTYHSDAVYTSVAEISNRRASDRELPEFAPAAQTAFYSTLRKRLDEYFVTNKKNSKNGFWIWVRYVLIGLACSAARSRCSQSAHSWLFGVAVSVVQGFACAMVGLMPLHDASHFSVTKSPVVWKVLMHCHDFLNGASSLIWTYQHVLGHHPYTNVEGADPDIDTAEHDVRRIKRSQPWYSHYLLQHAYAPVLYGLLAWKTRLQDITMLHVLKANGAIRINRRRRASSRSSGPARRRGSSIACSFRWPSLARAHVCLPHRSPISSSPTGSR